MLYIILGMHKSGTTLVAEVLHKSGIQMVEDSVTELDYDTGNKYERLATQRLNKDILQCHDRESYEIGLPDRLTVSDVQRYEMETLLQAEETAGHDWGFKDPRTCLTYRLWQNSLPAHRLIVVSRLPSSVYAHYRDQAGKRGVGELMVIWRALRSWALHNRQILRILRDGGVPCLMISYEQLMSTQEEFDRLQDFVGRPLVDARKSGMNRKRPGGDMRMFLMDCIIGLLGGDRPLGLVKEMETIRLQQVVERRAPPPHGPSRMAGAAR